MLFFPVSYDLIDTETHTELVLISVVYDHRTALQNKKSYTNATVTNILSCERAMKVQNDFREIVRKKNMYT